MSQPSQPTQSVGDAQQFNNNEDNFLTDYTRSEQPKAKPKAKGWAKRKLKKPDASDGDPTVYNDVDVRYDPVKMEG